MVFFLTMKLVLAILIPFLFYFQLMEASQKVLVTEHLPPFDTFLDQFELTNIASVFYSLNIFETQYVMRLNNVDFNIMVCVTASSACLNTSSRRLLIV